MNETARPPERQATTQAADGLPRLEWTLAEFERLGVPGFFGGTDSERVELIDGEIIPMLAKAGCHAWARGAIACHLTRRLADGYRLCNEPGWRPGGERHLEPEIVVCPEGFRPDRGPPAEVLLLIEVSDSSLKYDEGMKARILAEAGVRKYRGVDARSLVTKVHTKPGVSGYTSVLPLGPDEALQPSSLPALSLSLGSLGIG